MSPLELFSMLFGFMLASFVGYYVIQNVSRLLHTPLMSLTNAISAIAVVASIIIAGEKKTVFSTVLGAIAVFARRVSQEIRAPIAIIKCAAGGTTLGGDWNPDAPSGFKLYPLALQLIQSSLAELERKKVAYRIEGFMWHQGENDMFSKEFKPEYGKNLREFLAAWRRDLKTPNLTFCIEGEQPCEKPFNSPL